MVLLVISPNEDDNIGTKETTQLRSNKRFPPPTRPLVTMKEVILLVVLHLCRLAIEEVILWRISLLTRPLAAVGELRL